MRRLWVLAVVLLLTGCGAVPTPRGVTVVRRVPAAPDADEPDIRRVAPGPSRDATPEQIVRGFLQAQSSDDDDHAVARQFLAPQRSWDAGRSLVVYDESSLEVDSVPVAATSTSTRVTVRLRQVGRVLADASYVADRRAITDSLALVRVDGQWRISQAPPGVRLTGRDFDRSYRAVTTWFLADGVDGHAVLVPDPRYLAVSRQALPSALVRALLSGPSAALAAGVRSALPVGAQLVGSAAVVDGVAGVELSSDVAAVRSELVSDLLAQVGATLGQLPEVSSVRVTVEGRPLPGATSRDPQAPEALVGQLDPDVSARAQRGYAVRAGQVVALDAASAVTTGAQGLTAPAVSSAGQVAALQGAGPERRLAVGALGSALRPRAAAAGLVTPSWGRDGSVWLLDTATPSVVVIGADGGRQELSLPASLRAARPVSARLSADGARLLVASSRGVDVLTVTRGRRPALGAARPVMQGAAIDAAWASSGTVVLVTSSGRAVQAAADGSTASALSQSGLPGPVTQVAARPGLPVLAASGGTVFALVDGRWQRRGAGTDPVYGPAPR